ncbi:hypothetical protein AB8616_11405 [Marinomonas sp. RS-M-Aa-14]|uniref:hypothetical protein n=1 Tax=Marinomonas sp. RS-M-Aa-14 TaxID=3241169 RepID=UPI003AAA9023
MVNVSFTNEQLLVLNDWNDKIDPQKLVCLFNEPELEEQDLVSVLGAANALYRSGAPVISDNQYDLYISMLRNINHLHPYLNKVEPEVLAEAKTVELPQRMLSTEKAYSIKDIEKWLKRISKAAQEIEVSEQDIQIRITPKLDGYAAYDDGETLYTRGMVLEGKTSRELLSAA